MLFKKLSTWLITNWINEGFGWGMWLNVSIYRPLSGSSYIKLHSELRSPKKGLISIKNNNQKYFFWCHVRHINPVKIYPERIKKEDKKLVNSLSNDGIEFPTREKDFSMIEKQSNICICNVFCCKNKLTFPIYLSDQKLKNSINLMHIIDDDKSYYVYIKDFNKFMFHKAMNNSKSTF